MDKFSVASPLPNSPMMDFSLKKFLVEMDSLFYAFCNLVYYGGPKSSLIAHLCSTVHQFKKEYFVVYGLVLTDELATFPMYERHV